MTGIREQIGAALYNRLVDCWQWGETGRRLKLAPDVGTHPAFFITQTGTRTTRQAQLPIRTLDYLVAVYTLTPQADGAIPATEQNEILDAIDAALAPGPAEPGRQTLGGLCHSCYVDGDTTQSGDLDGDGRMVVPIRVLIP